MPCSIAMPFGHRGLLLALAVVGVAHFGGCRPSVEAPPPVVEDLTYSLLPSGARIVTGQLFNPSDADLPGAQIQVSLFDASNSRVGSVSIPVQAIPAGGRVSFRQPIESDEDVQAARVRSVIVL